MAGCIIAVHAIVCFELPAREASSFCDFWKLTSCDFISYISTFIEVNLIFIDVLKISLFSRYGNRVDHVQSLCRFQNLVWNGLRINLPNLCPNINHFDEADFSECHSEEVISFFWRSVYIDKPGTCMYTCIVIVYMYNIDYPILQNSSKLPLDQCSTWWKYINKHQVLWCVYFVSHSVHKEILPSLWW